MDRQDTQRTPQFQVIKDFVEGKITSGTLRPGDRVPSEKELVAEFSVSRMTVNRALNELASEGAISRFQGVGSFVTVSRSEWAPLEILDIREEIEEAGQDYACRPVLAKTETRTCANEKLGLPPGSEHAHVTLVHLADGVPVQLEDRWVNPAFSPGFLEVDFTAITPYRHLMSLGPLQAAEYAFDAALPSPDMAEWLEIGRDHPCTELRRRTWSLNIAASYAILTAPRSRRGVRGVFGALPPLSDDLPAI